MRHGFTLLFLLFVAGCGFHGQKPTLQFSELPYTALSGRAWPERSVELPGVQARHGLVEAPRLHYVELNPEGKDPIVFLHGLGSYLKFWRHQLDVFAESGHRVIALDHLGFGKSDKPATYPYDLVSQSEALREVLDALGLEQPILIGHSMGAQMAMTLAIGHPGRMKALVLVSPAGFERFSARDKLWFKQVFSRTLVHAADEASLWDSIRYNNFNRWRDEHEWLIEERARITGNADFDAYAYANVRAVQGLLDTEFVRANLGRIAVKTVILYGDQDRLIPNRFMHAAPTRRVMEFGHAGIEGSELVELEGCGHTAQMDCPEEVNREVFRFLASLGIVGGKASPSNVGGTQTATVAE